MNFSNVRDAIKADENEALYSKLRTAGSVVATLASVYFYGKSKGKILVFVATNEHGQPVHTISHN